MLRNTQQPGVKSDKIQKKEKVFIAVIITFFLEIRDKH